MALHLHQGSRVGIVNHRDTFQGTDTCCETLRKLSSGNTTLGSWAQTLQQPDFWVLFVGPPETHRFPCVHSGNVSNDHSKTVEETSPNCCIASKNGEEDSWFQTKPFCLFIFEIFQ